ncbi:MAG TPA: histidine kinase [Nocardioidaceae bacterium]
MPLTDSTLRRLAWVTFAYCCGCYLLLAAMPLLAHWLGGSAGKVDGGSVVLGAMTFAFPVAGILVARQQPRNTLGWLMIAVGLVASFPVSAYAEYGLNIRPGSLPGADVAAAVTAANWAPVLGLVGTFLILLFPDGHLPSPRWRFVGWFSGLAIAWVYLLITLMPGKLEAAGEPRLDNPLGIPALGELAHLLLPTIVVLPTSFLLCAAGLIARFRRSSGVERLQLKWLATAGAIVALLYLAAMVSSLLTGISDNQPDPGWLLVIQNLAVYSFALVPVAIGIAILKHGLYEIDIVINKAVVFGTLAVFITTVYVAIVVGLGALVGTGVQPNLALSVAATAVVAVAFQPVQHRAQRVANRLVYGERATPYEVLSEFTDRVGGSYDAVELLPTMTRTIAHGVGAARTDVWLATGHRLVREATWPERDADKADGADGRAVAVDTLSEIVADRVVAVRHQGELLGALAVTKPSGDQLTPAEGKLLDDVAGQAGLVLRNVRLIEDLRGSRERLVTTQDEERRRLERNLHDGAQQRLVAVALMIRTARVRLGPDAAGLGPALDQAADQLQSAIEELRELARGIHPAILTERGLGPAIRSLVERSPVPVVLGYALDQRPPAPVEAALYFVVAEALTNIAKYARATQVGIQVTRSGRVVTLEVSDDGVGGADGARGSGLRGLVDRLAVVDGTLAVHSPPGRGTRLVCTVPVPTAPHVPDPTPTLVASS